MRGIALLALAACANATPVDEPAALQVLPPRKVSAPEVLGELAGPGAAPAPPGVLVYGTDMGLSYEHQGQTFIAFGDTWPTAKYICDEHNPHNDDTLARVPPFDGQLPVLEFLTEPDSAQNALLIELMRDGESLTLGYSKTPLTLFSDGTHVFSTFFRVDVARCEGATADDPGSCPADEAFACSTNLGDCRPTTSDFPFLCDPINNEGCFHPQQCMPVDPGYCYDTSSSQYDGTVRGERFASVQNIELGMQRADDPGVWDSVLVFQTSKFSNQVARTVRRFSGVVEGSDYRTGDDHLLVWGRPLFVGEEGREAQLYLLTHELPLELGDGGTLRWEPRYFAGLDPDNDQPIWSERQAEAKPLALDGRVDGDPHEEVSIVQQMTVSWLGPPIDQWLMMYGGDDIDFVLFDRENTRNDSINGSVVVRFADHPWGPWSPPVVHYAPGSPQNAGDPYGPGGILYHNECQDMPPQLCERSDPTRPFESYLEGCPAPSVQLDIGRLYCPNVIESYTAPHGDDGLDVYWNISTWNPYSVFLLKTTIR